MTGGETGGEAGGILPAAGTLEESEFKLLDPLIHIHLGGEVFEFGSGIGKHAQVGVADGRFSAVKVFPKFWQQTHTETYHTIRKNGRA